MKKVVFALLLPVLCAVSATAADKGEYKRWKLDFECTTPANVALKTATGDIDVCWYMTYKVTNHTDQAIPLQIAISAVTDTNKTYRDSIAPLAQQAIEKALGKKFKNAIDMAKGTIGPGKTIDAIALFGDVDPGWDYLHVHVAGLVDPIERVGGKVFFEKKVYVRSWYRPGDEFNSADDIIYDHGAKWVIEGKRKELPQKPVE